MPKARGKNHYIGVFVPETLHASLLKIADAESRPLSSVIRELLAAVLVAMQASALKVKKN